MDAKTRVLVIVATMALISTVGLAVLVRSRYTGCLDLARQDLQTSVARFAPPGGRAIVGECIPAPRPVGGYACGVSIERPDEPTVAVIVGSSGPAGCKRR